MGQTGRPGRRGLLRPRRPTPRTDLVVAAVAVVVALVVVPLLGVSFAASLATFAVAAALIATCGLLPLRFTGPAWTTVTLVGVFVLISLDAPTLLVLTGACGCAAGSGPASWLLWARRDPT